MIRFPRAAMVLAVVLLASTVGALAPATVGAADTIRVITLPIEPASLGQVHWSDTYGAPRGGGRSHLGVDMMGPKMTPLVSVADGTVTWFRHDSAAGNNLEITDAEGWKYHYIHINNDTPGSDDGANLLEYAFAPGIGPGVSVKAGQVVAYMGDSGNAEDSGSHLHFEIEDPAGNPVNPTPSVDAARQALVAPGSASERLGPYASAVALTNDVFTTLNGRAPTTKEAAAMAQAVATSGLSEALTPHVSSSSSAAQIDRLYVAYFLRRPDFEGLRYWIDQRGSGRHLTAIADSFADSAEFRSRYGSLDFGPFLDQLYRDVLHREPDQAGKAYWLDLLNRGKVSKGSIVVNFTEGQELIGVTELRSELVALTALFKDAAPTDAEIAAWSTQRATQPLGTAISNWFLA